MILCAAVCWAITLVMWALAPTVETNSLYNEGLTTLGSDHYSPEYDLQIYAVMCVLSLAATATTGYVVLRRRGWSVNDATQELSARLPRLSYFDLGVVLFVLCIVWIPNAKLLIEGSYDRDRFHHWNYYLLGPLQMYQQGAALGTEAYTQYQSGWVLLFAALGKFTTIDHPFVIQVMSLFVTIYFCAWYFVVRKLGFSSPWAAFCILLCLMMQHFLVFFNNINCTLWANPSSTVIRNPTDVFVLGSLLYLFQSNQLRYALSAGCFVGLGTLFGNDTGIYVVLATGGACFLRLIDPRNAKRRILLECAVLIGSALAVALAGLAIASRGTLFEPKFWSGYYEALRLYGNGFSAVPIQSFMNTKLSKLSWVVIFWGTLVLYTIAVARAAVLSLTGKASRFESLYAFIGIIGFGTLMLFINRSEAYNLTHVLVPSIVLCFVEFRHFSSAQNAERAASVSSRSTRWGLVLCAACVVMMFFKSNFRSHPSLLNTWTGNFSGEFPSQEYQELVARLPQLKREIEQRLGNQPYGVAGEDSTLWLMAFNKQSPMRYLPNMVLTRIQEQGILQELEEDNLVFCKRRKNLSGNDIQQLIERKYTLVESTPDYDIYRRSGLPPLATAPIESAATKPTREQNR